MPATSKKFLAVQMGARRGYAVPAILEKAGMLERFYTEISGDTGLGRWLAAGRCLPGLGRKLTLLASRRVPPEIRAKTRTFAGPMIRHGARLAVCGKDPASRYREHLRWSCDLGEAMVEAGFGNATHVFSMLGEGGPLLAAARRRGLRVVSEVYILISTERIMAEERKAFPDWEAAVPDFGDIRREYSLDDVLVANSDNFICPSEAVRDDLVANHGVASSSCVIVPYGMNPRWLELDPRPQKGRILFVGTADLRKGIHYFAMAAEKLSAGNASLEFRVAGNVSPRISARPESRRLKFLGRVPRDRIAEEYQQADVFVLPSLAEGSAEVTYEALAAGLPVITTRASGSVIRDGLEGRIIPERDPSALAEAIEQVVGDRALRDRMAAAARERARDYIWERYGERLTNALSAMP